MSGNYNMPTVKISRAVRFDGVEPAPYINSYSSVRPIVVALSILKCYMAAQHCSSRVEPHGLVKHHHRTFRIALTEEQQNGTRCQERPCIAPTLPVSLRC